MPKERFKKYMFNLQSLYNELLNEKPLVILLSGNSNSRTPLFWDEEEIETT